MRTYCKYIICAFLSAYLSSCILISIEQPYNTFKYSDHEISEIEVNIRRLNNLFDEIENKGVSKSDIGYFIYEDSTLYFGRYCLGADGVTYIPSESCNYASLLDNEEENMLMKSIFKLYDYDISGFGYDSAVKGYSYIIGFKGWSDEPPRYIQIFNDSSDLKNIESSFYELYDTKGDLLLFGVPSSIH